MNFLYFKYLHPVVKTAMKSKDFLFNLFMLLNDVEIKQQKIKWGCGGEVESLFHKLLESMALSELSLVHFSRAYGYLTCFNGNSLSECSSRDQMASYLETFNC